MSEKRETLEDAEGVVLQDPCDRVKARLPESQSPGVEPHTHRYSVYERCCLEPTVKVSWPLPSAGQPMDSESIEGDEWGTYVALDTFSTTGTRDGLRPERAKVTES
jgi:hypothetical protein